MIGEDETRLRDLENDMSRAYLEIEKLREQVDGLSSVSRQQTTEFTVPGIPSTLPEKDDDAVIAGVLGRIGAERFLPDITRVRRMKPRNSASEFWTLLVVCKSSVVRDEIVCLKIQKGDIAVSDIIPNQASAAERKLFLNEWLPRPVHELLQELHVLGVTETWLTDQVDDSSYTLDNYLLVGNDRDLAVDLFKHPNERDQIVEVSSVADAFSPHFLIAVVYNKNPTGPALSNFFSCLDTHTQSFKSTVILGDFIVNMLQATEYSDELRTLINDRSLHLIPSGPTHFRNSTATWIDLMIVDSGDTVVDYRVSDAPIAFGHCTTFLLYRFAVRSFESRVVSFRNFARCNVNALQSSLSDRLSGTFNLSSDHDPSDALDAVSTSVLAEFDLFAPGISRPFRRPPAPWMTDALRAECRQRDRLFQRARRLGSADLMNRYRTMRRELRSRMLCARRDYLNRCLEEQPDQAAVWRLLERHGVTVSRSSSAVGSLSLDELNEFYRGVASVHRPCSLAQLANIIAVEPFQTDSRFSFTPVTAMEMGRIFNDCVRRSRGRSSDGLTLQYLSHIWLVLLPYIDKLFNFCLSSSAYPDSWRRAFIVPLNTVSSPVSLADTRPIVNLPHLAKMFDRLFTRQMLNYLESNELILPNQFSFRSSHSIQHALLHLTDIVRAGIDDGLVTLLMLFDLRKAFDTADHVALLRCLRSLGFSDSALTFVPSYITRRTQVVIGSDGSSSDFMTVTSGVPQGSSPRAGLYIQCRPDEIECAIAHMNADADSLSRYVGSLDLSVNVAKTKAIIFGSSPALKFVRGRVLPPIVVNGQVVEVVDRVRSLGVVLSSDLTWSAHLSQISSRVHCILHRLRARAWLLSPSIKKLLVQALVLPHLDYACLVYNNVLASLNFKLQRLANTGVRFIFNIQRSDHSSVTLRREQLGGSRVEDGRFF
ncbi:hypothetical protein TKK_0000431 [Trichogramma kaykai]